MPKVSIIIAMYNIEEYIAYCINSCVNQVGVNPEDYEIIIVNDGATDNSFDVAQEAIRDVTNARIISRTNGGLSAARNTGIEAAKGEYLWFVDGDDAIMPNALNVLIANFNRSKSDAYIINFSTFDGEKKLETSNFIGSNVPLSGEEYHFKHNRTLPMMAWLTIYRSEFIRRYSLNFMLNIIHEDQEFCIRAHHLSSSIVFINEDLYLYRVGRPESIMTEIRKDNTKSLLSEIKILNSFKSFFADANNNFVYSLYGTCALAFLRKYYHPLSSKNSKIKTIFKENKRTIYKDLWNSRRWKLRLFLVFIICMPQSIISSIIPRLDKSTKFI